jgi:hypothetical protein
VCQAGPGRAGRHVGTRCHSAVTGPDVGRGRSIRAVDCWTGVATWKRGGSPGEGGRSLVLPSGGQAGGKAPRAVAATPPTGATGG